MAPVELSVFVSCYNKGAYIAEALQSILNQVDAPAFELLVLDDGSTDASPDVIRRILQDVPNARMEFLAENQGLRHGMDWALKEAKGTYFCRFDGDDVWKPHCLNRLHNVLISEQAVSVFADIELIDQHGSITSKCGNIYLPDEVFLTDFASKILRRNFIAGNCFMAETAAWRKAHPIPERIQATIDWYFNIHILHSGKCLFLDEPLASYRVHSGNLHVASLLDGRKERTWLVIRDTFLNSDDPLHAKIRLLCELDLVPQLLGAEQYEGARRALKRAKTDSSWLHLMLRKPKFMAHAFTPRLYHKLKRWLAIR